MTTSSRRKIFSWRPCPWSGTRYDNKYCQNPDWRYASFAGWPDLVECPWNPLQQPVEKGEGYHQVHIFDETAFRTYVNPTKCCHAALSRGVSTSLSPQEVSEWGSFTSLGSQVWVRGTVRFMSRKLTPVAVACRIHDNTDVNIWLW